MMDLSAVFGNALDNAIEYEVQIPDPAKRLIHVTVSSQRGFVLLRFENYCQDSLRFREGLPVTTKKDKSNHGYGLKSIRFVAEKYGGIVTVKQEREWSFCKSYCPFVEIYKNDGPDLTKTTTATTECGKKRAVYAVPPTSDPYYGINWSTGPKHGSAARNTAQKSECERGGNQYVSNQHG